MSPNSGRIMANLVGIGLILWVVAGSPVIGTGGSNESQIEEPSAKLQDAVTQIGRMLKYDDAAPTLAACWGLVGSEVMAHDSAFKTTADVQEVWKKALAIMEREQGDGKIGPPGLSKAVNQYLEEQLSLDPVALDDDKRQATAEAFRALAWAAGG